MKKTKHTPTTDSRYTLLMNDLEKTAVELNAAYTNLQNVVDPDLIDYYIYQAKAVQMRYKFLLNCVKQIENSLNNTTSEHSPVEHSEASA